MQTHIYLRQSLLASLVALASVSISEAQSVSINFNGGVAADWTSQFVQNNGTQGYTWLATAGITDQAGPAAGGGLVTGLTSSQNPSIVFTTSSLNGASNNSFTISAKIRGEWTTNTTNGNGMFHLGFGSDTTANFGGSPTAASFAIRLQSTTTAGSLSWQTRNNNTNAAISGASNVTGLSASNWYGLTATFTETTLNNWSFTAQLLDFGAAGTGLGSSITNGSVSGTLVNSGMFSASNLFAAVNFRDAGSSLTNHTFVDDLSFSAIPEPSSFAALAGLGALGLVATLRRRR